MSSVGRMVRGILIVCCAVMVVGMAAVTRVAQAGAPTTTQPVVMSVANTAGVWEWTVPTPNGDITHMMKLSPQTGASDKLTGTFYDSFDGKSFPIKDAQIKDGKLTIKIARPLPADPNGGASDATLAFTFIGSLDAADKINGTLDLVFGEGDPMQVDWHATRGTEADLPKSSTTQPAN